MMIWLWCTEMNQSEGTRSSSSACRTVSRHWCSKWCFSALRLLVLIIYYKRIQMRRKHNYAKLWHQHVVVWPCVIRVVVKIRKDTTTRRRLTFDGGAVLWHHVAGQRRQGDGHKHHQQTGDLILLLWADVLCTHTGYEYETQPSRSLQRYSHRMSREREKTEK